MENSAPSLKIFRMKFSTSPCKINTFDGIENGGGSLGSFNGNKKRGSSKNVFKGKLFEFTIAKLSCRQFYKGTFMIQPGAYPGFL